MEIVIIVAIAIGVIGWWIWKEGKHESAGHPLESITKKMDVNQDGKVDVKDAVVVAEAVVEEVKTTAKKVKEKVAKTAAKKTATKQSKPKQPAAKTKKTSTSKK